jgi:hypothetical protein
VDDLQKARIKALTYALDEEVHGLWISTDMAVKVLAAVDAVTPETVERDNGREFRLPAR